MDGHRRDATAAGTVNAFWRWFNRPPVSVAIMWACFAFVVGLIIYNWTPIVSQWDWWQGFAFAIVIQMFGAAVNATRKCRT